MSWDFGDPVDELVGLTEPEARALAEPRGLTFRDITDGDYLDDARNDRVNVWCEDGVVTRTVIF